MDLRAVLRPVGPLPAGVYWRRRLLLLAAVALVLVVAVVLARSGDGAAARPASGSGAPAVTPSPARTAPAVPAGRHSTAAASPGTPPACRPADLAVDISADKLHYAIGEHPAFVVTVRNRGAAACRVDVGAAARRVVVRSGNDRIWASTDCGPTTHTVAVFRPGQQVAYSTEWRGHRSTPGCAVPESAAPAALPGTYRAGARVGRSESAEALFELVGG